VFYVDGRAVAEGLPPCNEEVPNASDIPLEIGIWCNAFGGWAPFPGRIDNVGFFDHARTAAQVCADSLGTWDGQACARPASEEDGP